MQTLKITAFMIATLTLAACETIQGAGQDISAAGAAISEESQEVQSNL